MKKLFILVFFSIPCFLWGQSEFGHSVLDGNLAGINNRLNDSGGYYRFQAGLLELNRSELRLLRNTIYAQYGYIFSSRDLQEHFSRFSWYNGTKTNVDSELTDRDKENISLIQRIEGNYPNTFNEDLIGYWAILPYHGDFWEEIENEDNVFMNFGFFSFYSNGTICCNSGGYGLGNYGLWKIENNKLLIDVLYEYSIYSRSDPIWKNIISRTLDLDFKKILSPNGGTYLEWDSLFDTKGGWILKIHNMPGRYDK
jgi:hypothetical protein